MFQILTYRTIHIQSSDPNEIPRFFQLLSPSIATELRVTATSDQYQATFELDVEVLAKRMPPIRTRQDVTVNKELSGVVGLYRAAGHSFQWIADRMNKAGYRNSRGRVLNKMQVIRLYRVYVKEVEQELVK